MALLRFRGFDVANDLVEPLPSDLFCFLACGRRIWMAVFRCGKPQWRERVLQFRAHLASSICKSTPFFLA